MKLRVAITFVFFIITGALCMPAYQEPNLQDAYGDEPEIPTHEKLVAVFPTSKKNSDTTEEIQHSTLIGESKSQQSPAEDGYQTQPGEKISNEGKVSKKKVLTPQELYAIESIGERVKAWSPESLVNADELGNDMIPPPSIRPEFSPTHEPPEYGIDNVVKVAPDVMLLIVRKVPPTYLERDIGSEQMDYGDYVRNSNGMLDGMNTIVIDKIYKRTPEYRIRPGKSSYIHTGYPYMSPYSPIPPPSRQFTHSDLSAYSYQHGNTRN